MKISKSKKLEIRRKILQAAVDIMTKKSFESASMREIAQSAGIGEATIYNYFSTKEQLLYGFIEQTHMDVTSEVLAINGFESFSLKEKLQMWFESLFIAYLPNREFVQIVFDHTYRHPMTSLKALKTTREAFNDLILTWVDDAIQRGEINDQPMLRWISEHVWDFGSGICCYWLKDDSSQFNQTTQLIDMSLDIIVKLLESNVLGRVSDMMSFLIKSHIFKYFDSKPTNDLLKKVASYVKI